MALAGLRGFVGPDRVTPLKAQVPIGNVDVDTVDPEAKIGDSVARFLDADVGVAINAVTPPAILEMVGHDVDFALALATDHTLNGDHALPRAADRVRRLRAGLPPAVRLEVDGGATTQNVAGFVAAGANDVVVGRALVENARLGRDGRAVPVGHASRLRRGVCPCVSCSTVPTETWFAGRLTGFPLSG